MQPGIILPLANNFIVHLSYKIHSGSLVILYAAEPNISTSWFMARKTSDSINGKISSLRKRVPESRTALHTPRIADILLHHPVSAGSVHGNP